MNWKFWKKPDSEYDKLIGEVDNLTDRVNEFTSDTTRFRYKKDGVTKEYF